MFLDSTMCTPIFPATEHPFSREPLRPTPSFPFSDCYQYTAPAPIVRIPTGGYKLSKATSLGDRDFMADSLYVDEDRSRRRARRAAREDSLAQSIDSSPTSSLTTSSSPETATADAQAQTSPSDARCRAWADTVDRDAQAFEEVASAAIVCCHPDELALQASLCNVSQPLPDQTMPIYPLDEDADADDMASDLHSDDGSADDLMHIFVDPFPDEDRIVIPLVRASLDLSEVDQVNDPALFLEEVKEIKQ